MSRKLIIVSLATWMLCILGGGMWGWIERHRGNEVSLAEKEVQTLKDLYNAKLYGEVLKECDRADHDLHLQSCRPQVSYVRWVTHQVLGQLPEAEQDRQFFIANFPDSVLAAEIHFSMAMNAMGRGEYWQAEKELRTVVDRFPQSAIATKSALILEQFRRQHPTTQDSRAIELNDFRASQ